MIKQKSVGQLFSHHTNNKQNITNIHLKKDGSGGIFKYKRNSKETTIKKTKY